MYTHRAQRDVFDQCPSVNIYLCVYVYVFMCVYVCIHIGRNGMFSTIYELGGGYNVSVIDSSLYFDQTALLNDMGDRCMCVCTCVCVYVCVCAPMCVCVCVYI